MMYVWRDDSPFGPLTAAPSLAPDLWPGGIRVARSLEENWRKNRANFRTELPSST